MSEINLSEYMGAYIDGARENLDTMDRVLLLLEQNPNNIQAIEEIFRAAHTLKGMSATMGFEKVAHLTHEMENILDKMRSRQVPVTTQVIDVIFETFDVLRILVNDTIAQTDSGVNLEEVIAKIHSVLSSQNSSSSKISLKEEKTELSDVTNLSSYNVANQDKFGKSDQTVKNQTSSWSYLDEFSLSEFERSGLAEQVNKGLNIYILKVTLVPDCLLKGPRVFMVLRSLDGCGCEIIKSIPDVKDLENEKFDRSFKMILSSEQPSSVIKESIESISEIEEVIISEINTEELKASASSQLPTQLQSDNKLQGTKLQQPQQNITIKKPQVSSHSQTHQTQGDKHISQQLSSKEFSNAHYQNQAPQYTETSSFGHRQTILVADTMPSSSEVQNNSSFVHQGYVEGANLALPNVSKINQQQLNQQKNTHSSNLFHNSTQTQAHHMQANSSTLSQTSQNPPISNNSFENKDNEKVEFQKEQIVQLVSFEMAGETYALDIKQVESIINLSPITRVPKAPAYIEGVINLRGEIIPVINLRKRLNLEIITRKPGMQIIILSFDDRKVKVGFLVDHVSEVLRLPESAIEPPSHISDGVDVEFLNGVGKVQNKIVILLNAEKIVFEK